MNRSVQTNKTTASARALECVSEKVQYELVSTNKQTTASARALEWVHNTTKPSQARD
jgi:hypothetical protein